MTLAVVFTPAGLATTEVRGRIVFVIDVLRAGTTICAALTHGARAVIPVADTEEALRLAQTHAADGPLLAGERRCIRIPGFALGNSPREMVPEVVRGKTVIMTTTNGTAALLGTASAKEVYLAGAANFSLSAAVARDAWTKQEEIVIVCAGREQAFALDDAYAAGRLVEAALAGERGRNGLNDAALAALDLVRRYGRRWDRPFRASQGGRDLIELGMQDDVADAAREDAYPVLATFADGRITAAPAGPATQASSTP